MSSASYLGPFCDPTSFEHRGVLGLPVAARLLCYVVFFAAAHLLGNELRLPDESFPVFWPPAAVAAVVLMLEPTRRWPLHAGWFLLLGAALAPAELGLFANPLPALAFAAVNAGEALAVVAALRLQKRRATDGPGACRFAGAAVAVSFLVPLLFALPTAAVASSSGGLDFGDTLVQGWLGHALGLLLLGPPLRGVLIGDVWRADSVQRPERGLFAASYALAAVLTCSTVLPVSLDVLRFQHLVVPLLVWAALRFNWRMVGWTLVATGILLVAEAQHHQAAASAAAELGRDLQLYLIAVGVPSMLLAVIAGGYRAQRGWTERSRAALESSEERRRELEHTLIEAQQSEAVGDVVSGVAHDMNNMLTVLMVHTDLLTYRLEGKGVQTSASAVREVTTYLSDLTSSLLAVSRRAVAASAVIDLRELVRSTLPLLRSAAASNVEVGVALTDRSALVTADETSLRQVLVNLVLNGAQAMGPDGGSIQVEVLANEDDCVLKVADEGTGIPSSLLSKIFEPCFSTKGQAGTGVGLAFVRTTVERHGGRVDVSSNVGAGTTFAVSLPLAKPTA